MNRPKHPGKYEFTCNNGKKEIMDVVEVSPRGKYGLKDLRVYWNGSYYQIHDCKEGLYSVNDEGKWIETKQIQIPSEIGGEKWGKRIDK